MGDQRTYLKYAILFLDLACGAFGLGFLIITAQFHKNQSDLVLSHGSALIALTISNAVTILIAFVGIWGMIKEKSSMVKIHAFALLIVAIITIGLVITVGNIKDEITHINWIKHWTENSINILDPEILLKMANAMDYIRINQDAYFGVGVTLICIQIISSVLTGYFYLKHT